MTQESNHRHQDRNLGVDQLHLLLTLDLGIKISHTEILHMTVAIAVIAARIDIEIFDGKIKIDTPPTKFIQPLLNLLLLKILNTVHTVRIVHGNINSLLHNTNATMILVNNNNKGNTSKIGTEIRQRPTTRKMPTNNVNAPTVENENSLITNKVKIALNIGIDLTVETAMPLTIDSEVKTEQADPQ